MRGHRVRANNHSPVVARRGTDLTQTRRAPAFAPIVTTVPAGTVTGEYLFARDGYSVAAIFCRRGVRRILTILVPSRWIVGGVLPDAIEGGSSFDCMRSIAVILNA